MNDPNICSKCMGDDHFSDWIMKHGKAGTCDMNPAHAGLRKISSASELAVEVDRWFRENYVQGEYEYSVDSYDRILHDQRGELYTDILAEELGCEEYVVSVVSDHLPDASSRDIAQGDAKFYDDTCFYESLASIAKREKAEFEEYWYENRFYFQWKDFCEAATHRRRFFGLKELLDDLFGDPKEYEGGDFSLIYDLPVGQKIYRARLIDDPDLRGKVDNAPAVQLGAPPKDRARAGRMNVEFIPGFYAAFGEDTAVAEIRPGIGEVIAIGEFELHKPLKVFDFTVFSRIKSEVLNKAFAHTRYEFIREMEGEISKPILPNDKQREYIPTQIVAEYLGECFACDAVIYRSSMVKDRDAESRNIVLLNKGIDFLVGAGSSLLYKSHLFKEVRNVTYDLREDFAPF